MLSQQSQRLLLSALFTTLLTLSLNMQRTDSMSSVVR